VEAYIKQNGHLPSIPSAVEVAKDGVNLVEMDAKLLQKIEELTLYVIQIKKENEALKSELHSIQTSR
jgi:trimeric autotransporter adhesin